MELRKITDRDLLGKGVIGMADTPNLSARAMQEKVEEIVRTVVIPVINENVDGTVSQQQLAQTMFTAGSGDMVALTYDNDLDGTVDRADNGFFTYTHSRTGNTHYLTGTGENIKFTATADFAEGDVFVVGGVTYPAYLTNGDILPDGFFKKGFVVSCFKNGDSLNFNGGGAGNVLNFKVVGGATQPASPAENTIWVNTDTAISEYSFRGAQVPEFTAKEGYVHITAEMTGSSSATLNILKKNSIYAKLSNVYQYEGTGWIRKNAYIYQGGNWVQLSGVIVEIYPGSNVTTMFTANTGVISGFKISRTGYEEGYGMAYITVNLTGISQMTVQGSLGDCCGMCLSYTLPQANANPGALSVASQQGSYVHESIWYKNNWDTETTISVDETVDVSGYDGSCYLILALYGSHVGRPATRAEITLVQAV